MDTLIEKWLRNDRQSSLSARKRAASASFQPRGQLLRALRVQSRGGRHPALAGDPDGVRGVFELPDRMRVRPHREEYALLAPRSAETPVEVETVWRAVDFDRATGASRRREHGFHVGVDAFPSQEKPARRVSEDRDSRVLDCADQPARLLLAGKPESRVDGGHHDLERVEEFVAVVDRAVGEDVRFGPVKDPRPGKPGLRLANRLPLAKDAVRREPARVAGSLAVVRDRGVLVAGCLRGADHFLECRAAVGFRRVDVDQSAEVGLDDEVRQRAPGGRFDLALSFAQLRLDERKSQAPVNVRLGPGRSRLGAAAPAEYALLVEPEAPLPREFPEPGEMLFRSGRMKEGGGVRLVRDDGQVRAEPFAQT